MLVATDWFEGEDYPIYVPQGENPNNYRPKDNRVMECYDLSLDKGAQLLEFRANHWEYKK